MAPKDIQYGWMKCPCSAQLSCDVTRWERCLHMSSSQCVTEWKIDGARKTVIFPGPQDHVRRLSCRQPEKIGSGAP